MAEKQLSGSKPWIILNKLPLRVWLGYAILLIFGVVLAGTMAYFNGYLSWPWQEATPTSWFGKAVAEFEKAIELEPGNPEGYRWLSKTHMLAGQPEQALEAYQRAIQYNPDQGWPYVGLGEIYEQQEQPLLAIRQYQQALEIEPENETAYQRLGAIYQQRDEPDKMLALYEQAAEMHPDQAWPYLQLGELYLAQGQVDKAQAAYAQAIAVQPDDAQTHFKLGDIYRWRLNQLDQAISHYRSAVAIEPGNAGYHVVLGSALYASGQEEVGLQKVDLALKLQPQDPTVRQIAGELYLQSGDLVLAQTHLEQAVEFGSNNAYAYLNLVRLHKKTEHYADALDHSKQALVAAEDQSEVKGLVYLEQAEIYQALEQIPAAEQAYRLAAQELPNSGHVCYLWGRFYQETGQREQAIEKFQECAVLEPQLSWPRVLLATEFLRQKDIGNGLRELQQALILEPENQTTYEQAKRLLQANPQLVLPALKVLPRFAPDQLPVYLTAGRMLGEFEAWPAALEVYQRALEQGLADPRLFMALGDAYKTLGDEVQADVYYDKADATNER